jgi:alkylation response protein AidB-like acyl-CoA dehydrogenase
VASDGQQRSELQGAVRDMLRDLSDDEHVRAIVEGSDSYDAKLWTQILQMGVFELALAANQGDDGGYAELSVVFEELGYALAPVPALSTVSALTALDLGGDAELAANVLAGTSRVTIALTGDGVGWGKASGLTAIEGDGGWTVTGSVAAVPDLLAADAVVVVAETAGGPALFVVPLGEAGVQASDGHALDLTKPVGDLALDGVSADLLVASDRAAEVIARISDVSVTLLAAENTGVSARALDTAVSYAKVRVQFGRQIGSFQAVKHSCVDIFGRAEGARSLVEAAAAALDAGAPDASLHVATAAAYAGEGAVESAERNLQAHGGIGYTWEHSAHLLVRRAKSNQGRLGQPWEHWERVATELATR